MPATLLHTSAFLYVESDVPPGQTLVGWRRDRETARRSARRPGRFRPRLHRPASLRARLAH